MNRTHCHVCDLPLLFGCHHEFERPETCCDCGRVDEDWILLRCSCCARYVCTDCSYYGTHWSDGQHIQWLHDHDKNEARIL